MAFICESCNTAQAAGTKMEKVVTEVRRVKYPQVKDRDGNIRVPEGLENAKELEVCQVCFGSKSFSSVVVNSKEMV